MGERTEVGRETINEWFQWLKEKLEETESDTPPTPAHFADKNWTPQKL